MKLIQVQKPGPPGVMQLLDVPVPEPKPGEVLIKAHAIGVGMPDCLIRAGTYSWMPPLPATPGTELAGTIEKVGAGVTSRQVGQRVYTTARERPHRGGHYADYVATPAEATFLLPDGVAFDAAAALANYQVAYHIFNDALALRQGQTVLIYAAAGGMGNALIDLAKVSGSDRDRRGLERSQGALRPRAWRRSRHRPQDRKSRRARERDHGRPRRRCHHRSGRWPKHSRQSRAAGAVRHAGGLWRARRQGGARSADHDAGEQELAGDPAILHPHLGSSGRGAPRRHARADRHAGGRKTAIRAFTPNCRSPKRRARTRCSKAAKCWASCLLVP